jgi:hypothetical protein
MKGEIIWQKNHLAVVKMTKQKVLLNLVTVVLLAGNSNSWWC